MAFHLSRFWRSLQQNQKSQRRPRRRRGPREQAAEQLEVRCLLSTFMVTNTNNSGTGSLRQAILDANAAPGADVILFNVGSGLQTISPTSALPSITGPVTIDATTQPGYAGEPLIELTGANAGSDVNGLFLSSGSSTIRGLVINRFRGNGILVFSSQNVIEGNYIGTDTSGTIAQANTSGISIWSSGNMIGGSTPGSGNVISGNTFHGIGIAGSGSGNNVIQGNLIGTDRTGTVAVGNLREGVRLNNGSGNLVGGGSIGAGNVISGNGSGINIDGATRATIQGNRIGTNAAGTAAVPNRSIGILVSTASNLIGTDADGVNDDLERNVVSGNAQYGVQIAGTLATGNVVAGNYIGTDATAAISVPNTFDGILIGSAAGANVIGGSQPGIGNIISGNGRNGINLWGAGQGNVVRGNRIGTNAAGTVAIANSLVGIQILFSSATVIGTNGDGVNDGLEGNLISGNGRDGVSINGTGSEFNVVAGNLIGTDVTGTLALGNGSVTTDDGVSINNGPRNNRIGTNGDGLADELEGNVISGNSGHGVVILGAGSNQNVVAGNRIGTTAFGTAPIGNGFNGVWVGTHGAAAGPQLNRIGTDGNGVADAAEGNVISFNKGTGVSVLNSTAVGNSIRGNSIFANTKLGIDLNDNGVTANDIGDADSGPNNLQNFPVITSAASNPTKTVVTGTLDSNANTTFSLDFYSNAASDPSGFGEGETYLGTATVTTDSNGHVAFSATLPVAVPLGRIITGTATDPNGNTSEFSGNVTGSNPIVVALNQPPLANAGGPYTINEGEGLSLDASTTSDPDSTVLTYRWDVDGDGDYDESVIGVTPTLSAAQMAALGLNDGPNTFLVTVEVSDGIDVGTATTTLTINNVAPDFEAGSNETLLPAVAGAFSRSLSFTDPGVDAWIGTIDFGDGLGTQVLSINQATKSFELSHVYAADGTYTVSVTVTDDNGGMHTDSFEVTVILNTPPVANDDSVTTDEDRPVTFDVLGNDADSENNLVASSTINLTSPLIGLLTNNGNGTFSYDPGSAFQSLAVGESATVTFDYGVFDTFGEYDVGTVTITINGANDAPSVAVANASVAISEGQSASNSGSWSDIDVSDVVTLSASVGMVTRNADGTWNWNFDTNDGPDQSQTVTVTATDLSGTASNTTFQLSVNNVAPDAAISGPASTLAGTGVNFTLGATDISSADQAADFTYEIDWDGDGSVDQTVSGADGLVVGHSFASAGLSNVIVTATDKDGGMSTPVTHSILVIQPVNIDVKPDSSHNKVNVKSQGVIPVAILTTAGFDAAQVIGSSVQLEGVSASHFALEDVDRDGDLDLILHFRTQDLLDALGLSLNSGDSINVATKLTGETIDQVMIEGIDTINFFLTGNGSVKSK